MLKMMISARRNPALTRTHFFSHLRHEHWPLLQRYPEVLSLIGGYVQNHALETNLSSLLRVASERDSVIELFFRDEKQLDHLIHQPDYIAYVRPDEAYFNALEDNVMVKVREEVLFSNGTPGRCKRFDFLARTPNTPADRFRELIAADGRRLSLDPNFTASVDRLVDNVALGQGDSAGFGTGAFDIVREYWASSIGSLNAVAMSNKSGLPIDRSRSFTLFATEFVMKPVPASW